MNVEVPQEIFEAANDFTSGQMDKKRLVAMYQLLAQVQDVPGDVVELGCGEGRTAAFLSLCMETLGSAFDRKELHLFDAFPALDGMIRPCERLQDVRLDPDGGIAKVLVTFEDLLDEELNRSCIHTGWFEDSLKYLPNPIAFVHVDCDSQDSIQQALVHCYYRLAPGGIAVIDDYGLGFMPCVKPTVDKFLLDKPEFAEETVVGIQGMFKKLGLKKVEE